MFTGLFLVNPCERLLRVFLAVTVTVCQPQAGKCRKSGSLKREYDALLPCGSLPPPTLSELIIKWIADIIVLGQKHNDF